MHARDESRSDACSESPCRESPLEGRDIALFECQGVLTSRLASPKVPSRRQPCRSSDQVASVLLACRPLVSVLCVEGKQSEEGREDIPGAEAIAHTATKQTTLTMDTLRVVSRAQGNTRRNYAGTTQMGRAKSKLTARDKL
eukprot:1175804-Prorocentrum_minimum.AAC.3